MATAFRIPTHPWDDDSDDSRSSASTDSEDDAPPSQRKAAKLFVEYILSMYMVGMISAKTFCTICYYASLAGIEAASPYGRGPSKNTGRYQAYLDRVLGFKKYDRALYEIEIPGVGRRGLSRVVHKMSVMNPHEALAEELRGDGGMIEQRLDGLAQSGGLPPCYYAHPVVQGNGCTTIPIAIYMDGVPYSQVDSVLGVWITNLISGQRHLVAVWRKKLSCRCGCRGWCSLFEIMRWLVWSLRCAARGVYAPSRHDDTPWNADESWRRAKAGTPLGHNYAGIYAKGDWSEYCSTLGFPTWGSGIKPCIFCSAFGDNMYDPTGATPKCLPLGWTPTTDIAYFEACSRCEVVVVLDAAAHREVKLLLKYDRRASGWHGRCLTADIVIAGTQLRAGDRLEPSHEIPNIGKLFDDMAAFPVVATFWRASRDTITRHRNPLFDCELGLGPMTCLTIDVLHGLHFGPILVFNALCIWRLLLSGIWGGAESTGGESIQVAVLCIRGDLRAFYREWKQSHPDDYLTPVRDVTVKMVGKAHDRKLKVKAAEAWGVLLYVGHAMKKYHAHLGNDATALVEAADALIGMTRVMQRAGWNFTPRELADSCLN